MVSKPALLAPLAFTIVIAFASRSQADFTASASEQSYYDMFARLQNGADGNGDGECAATSLINSFLYLQQRYPGVYDNKLVPGGPAGAAAARDALHTMIVNDGDENDDFGLQGGVWNQKLQWFQNAMVANQTIFAAQTGVQSGTAQANQYNNSNLVTFGQYPTFAWLQQQIADGEDVEFGLYQHMMTLIGVGTDNSNASTAIEYIDPNNPAVDAWADVSLSMGALMVTIPGSGYGPPMGMPAMASDTSAIYYAFAESPVPEPSRIVGLLGLAAIGLVGIALHRRKAA